MTGRSIGTFYFENFSLVFIKFNLIHLNSHERGLERDFRQHMEPS